MSTYISFIFSSLLLFLGFILSVVLSSFIKNRLEKYLSSSKLSESEYFTLEDKNKIPLWISRIVFYALLLMNLLIYLLNLDPDSVSKPLAQIAMSLKENLPLLGKGLILFILAIITGFILKALTVFLLQQKMASKSSFVKNTNSFSWVVFWFCQLLFLPLVLSSFGFAYLLSPAKNKFVSLMNELPLIFNTMGIFLGGVLAAYLSRKIVQNFLHASGIDAKAKETTPPSQFLGTLVFLSILFPTVISTLQKLPLGQISETAHSMSEEFYSALPQIIFGMIIIAVGVWISTIVKTFVESSLTSIGFNNGFIKLGFESTIFKMTPSAVMGILAQLFVNLFSIQEGLAQAQFLALADLMDNFTHFAIQITLGLFVLLLGILLSQKITSLFIPTSNVLLKRFFQAPIIILTAGMGLWQMGIASNLILMVFGSFFAAICLSLGIALGFSSRATFEKEITYWYTQITKKRES